MKELKSVFSREELTENAVKLLKKLIATPSMSRDEYNVSLIIEGFFNEHQIKVNRFKNNIWASNKHFDAGKPSILLNTHHDTVKPNKAYTLDPFIPVEKDGKYLVWEATMQAPLWWQWRRRFFIFMKPRI